MFADRREMVKSLAPYRNGRIAEIGVEYGRFTEFMMEHLQPFEFHAYDIFDLHTYSSHGGKNPQEVFEGKTHREWYEARFAEQMQTGKLKTYEGDSSARMAEQPDAFFDLIYIDGDHTLRGAMRDAMVAMKKIKPSGMIIFNDYIMWSKHAGGVTSYGVVQAANELCAEHGWRFHSFALQGAMYCDVALVRA